MYEMWCAVVVLEDLVVFQLSLPKLPESGAFSQSEGERYQLVLTFPTQTLSEMVFLD